MIAFDTSFDGANPKADGIVKISANHFRIMAFSETSVESFRLELRLVNDSDRPQKAALDIEWPTVPFSELRDCFYVRNDSDDDWTPVRAATAPGKSFAELNAPPGKTFFCLHPHYGYDDSERFAASLDPALVRQEILEKSDKGRVIRLLKAGTSDENAPGCLVAARNHANESSGNYCVEGMMSWLLGEEPPAVAARENIRFHFVPMSNPDGVADGMARFTGLNEVNLNMCPSWYLENKLPVPDDKSHRAFIGVLERLRPDYFVNLHSYLFQDRDEIFALSDADADKFTKFMPDQRDFGKYWKRVITDHRGYPTGMCREKFGTFPLLLEIPWFGRNAKSMRLAGERIIKALSQMILEDKKIPRRAK